MSHKLVLFFRLSVVQITDFSPYMIQYPITPWIMLEELNKFKLLYGNPPIFIHENGLSLPLSLRFRIIAMNIF